MNKNEEKTKLHDPDVLSADADVQADVDSVMRKYDRESNTRIWEGKPKIAITVILAAFSLWCIYVTLFATFLEEIRLTSFMGLIILMGFLIYPSKKGDQKVNHMPISDIIFMIVGVGSFFYFTFNVNQIINQGTRFTWFQIVIGILAILALIEVTRRCVGLPILIVAGVFIVYALAYGLTNPEVFGRLRYLVRNLFYTKEGIFSTPVNVCSKYIVVFIIFGAFLERTGISNFFIDLANCIAGRFAGGPAKVSVISSALCGMVSGSSVGNTVTTGSVTIPMMKKTGYKPEFAGAVEATSSTGGQIMPPIMGAAAFLMADFVGVPYSSIIGRAILPAILYFAGIFISVHLEAKKLDLHGMPKEQLPKAKKLVKKIYLLLPLVMLVVWVSGNFMTMQKAASLAIVLTVVVSLFNKDNRITPGKILEALEAGGKSAITVGAACGVAGIISGTITMTGLANDIINAIVSVAGDRLIIALILTMLCCIVLGMGVPTTANYCKLLHHGRYHCPDSDSHGRSGYGCTLLCILLRHRRRYHPAGCAGSLRRFCHCQEQPDENRIQRVQARRCRIYRTVHVLFQPCYAADRHDSHSGCTDFHYCIHWYLCAGRCTGRLLLRQYERCHPHCYRCRRSAAHSSGTGNGSCRSDYRICKPWIPVCAF